MDVHVPLAIARGLRRRNVDVLTSHQDGTTQMPDDQLLDRATELRRALFTRDLDLVVEAARRQRIGQMFFTVIFARQLDVSIGRCVADLEIIAKTAMPEEALNQILYLPL